MTTASTPPVVTDDDLMRSVPAAEAVAWMREAATAAHEGRLLAPARVSTDLGDGRLVFTTGAMAGEWFGYRSYDTFDVEPGEQVVVLHSARTGRVQAIAVGNALGRIRTGALGGLAAQVLAREESHTLGVDCAAVASVEAAIRNKDIVVLATSSRTPVIDPRWLAPGTHVTTVGPKQQGAAEFGLALVDAADVVVTDSLAQLHAYDPPSMVASSAHADRVRSLGAVAADPSIGRAGDAETTLYLSVGLAGSEVHLLGRVAARSGFLRA